MDCPLKGQISVYLEILNIQQFLHQAIVLESIPFLYLVD